MVNFVSVENLFKKERYILASTDAVARLCSLDVKEFELETFL